MIEVDGGGHGDEPQKEKDRIRDEFLTREGWKMIRIWNSDIDENLEGVMEEIWQIVNSPSPQPSPQRERESLGHFEKIFPEFLGPTR